VKCIACLSNEEEWYHGMFIIASLPFGREAFFYYFIIGFA